MIKSLAFLFSLFCLNTVYSQQAKEAELLSQLNTAKSDSERVKAYLELSEYDIKYNKAKAKGYAAKALDLTVKKNYPVLTILSIQHLSASMRYTENIANLFELDTIAIKKSQELHNNLLLFSSLNAYAKDLLAFNKLSDATNSIEKMKGIYDVVSIDENKANLLFTEGLYYFKIQNLKEAKKCFDGSSEIASKINDQYLVALNKLRLFNVNVYSGIIDESAGQAFEALNYFKQNNYLEDLAYAQFLIGDGYRLQGNLLKANQYYAEAYPAFVRLPNYLFSANVQSSYYQGYLLKQKMDLVKKSVELIQDYFSKLNYEAGLGMAGNFWGQYYSTIGKYALADSFFDKSLALGERLNIQSLKSISLMYKAQNLDRQNKGKEADSIALKAYASVQKNVSKELIENSFKDSGSATFNRNGKDMVEKKLYLDSNFRKQKGFGVLQNMREKNGDSSTGRFYQPLLSVFDSSLTVTYNRQLMDLETKYKTKIVSDSLHREQQNALFAAQKIKFRNVILIAVIAVSLLLLAGFALQYRNRKRAEKDKEKIQLLQNEIHHRVKNNLGVISRLVDIAGKNAVDDVPLSSLKTRIKSIELLHKHLYADKTKPGNISLQAYLDDLCLAIAATFETGKDIRIKVDAREELESHAAEKLGLIINELVTNSYKYAFEGKTTGNIYVTAKRLYNKNIEIAVADDGIGFESGTNKNSYGMKLIKGLSHELNGRFSFENNGGTQFQLSIPA